MTCAGSETYTLRKTLACIWGPAAHCLGLSTRLVGWRHEQKFWRRVLAHLSQGYVSWIVPYAVLNKLLEKKK